MHLTVLLNGCKHFPSCTDSFLGDCSACLSNDRWLWDALFILSCDLPGGGEGVDKESIFQHRGLKEHMNNWLTAPAISHSWDRYADRNTVTLTSGLGVSLGGLVRSKG